MEREIEAQSLANSRETRSSSASHNTVTSFASQLSHNESPFSSPAFNSLEPSQGSRLEFTFDPNLFPPATTFEHWNPWERSLGHAVDITLHTLQTSTFLPDETASNPFCQSTVLERHESCPLSGSSGPPFQQDWTIEGMGLEWLFDQSSVLAEASPASSVQGSLMCPGLQHTQPSISQVSRESSRAHLTEVAPKAAAHYFSNDQQPSKTSSSDQAIAVQTPISSDGPSCTSDDWAVQRCSDKTRSIPRNPIDSGHESINQLLVNEDVNVHDLDVQQSVPQGPQCVDEVEASQPKLDLDSVKTVVDSDAVYLVRSPI